MKQIQKLSLMLLLLAASSLQGRLANWLCRENRCRYEYDCCVNPLECGTFGVQIQGGIYPIKWNKRTDSLLVNCTGTVPVTVVSNLGTFVKFSDLFKLPWVVGVQLSYAMSCNTNVFAEFNYAQSSGSKCTFCNDLNSAFILTLASKYKLYNFFVGARYYLDRWCDRVSPFLGAKVGLVHHKRAEFTSLASSTVIADYSNRNFFNGNTVIAGGGQLGLDICVCDCVNVVITAEVIANCGPRVVPNILLSAADVVRLGGRVVLPGHVQTELAFPVTVGLKYNF